MNLSRFKATIAAYSTRPGDLVVLTVDSNEDNARRVGQALHAWALSRNVQVLVLSGDAAGIRLEVLDAERLASLGLQRIPTATLPS